MILLCVDSARVTCFCWLERRVFLYIMCVKLWQNSTCAAALVMVAGFSWPGYGQNSAGAGGSSVEVTIPASISQNGFTGSVPAGKATPGVLAISFLDAIDRGLKQNLGLLLSSDNTVAARGAKWKELSSLLPNVEAKGLENAQELSAATLGTPCVT